MQQLDLGPQVFDAVAGPECRDAPVIATDHCGEPGDRYGTVVNFYERRPPLTADERTQLTGWLELQRALVRRKLDGLTATDEHRAVLPGSPLMTPAGLVSHLRWTEHCWFNVIFMDESYAPAGTAAT